MAGMLNAVYTVGGRKADGKDGAIVQRMIVLPLIMLIGIVGVVFTASRAIIMIIRFYLMNRDEQPIEEVG